MGKPIINIDWSEAGNSDAFAEYVGALYRLVSQRPEKHAPFVAVVGEGDRVKVTQENVALEANQPRSRISGKKCDFPNLAATIRSFRSTHGVSDRTADRLRLNREEIAFLTQRITLHQSRLAASVLAIDRLRSDLKDRDAEIASLSQGR